VVGLDSIKRAIESKLGYKFEKNPELRTMNYKALERGIEFVQNR